EYITSHFKKEYFSPRSFEQSGGAHEAIRATRPLDAKELEELLHLQNKSFITNEHIKLYDLIFRYFIASQMKEAIVKEIEATIEVENLSSKVIFFSEIIENGANLLVPIELKSLKEGEYEITKELTTRPKVPRYTYAQIITLMKTKGIGRPSTYAITLEKLLERKYIYQKGTTLFATNLGIKVYEELKNNPSMYAFINEHYTKELEMLMDKVEEGQIELDLILAELKKKIMREIHREAV
ncbi:MAG: reverse gyrase, partial [Epsilonproteobacteria bacterium]|nr:reverse gyrase [Campylobacterota bacterium]